MSALIIQRVVLGLTLFVAGCGAGEETSQTASPATPSSRAAQGIVFLEEARANVPLTVLDESGRELAQARTDGNGFFEFPAPSGRFRVLASLEDGSRVEQTTDSQGFLCLNVISHLTSLYAADHPGVPLAECERAVKVGLSIPAGTATNGLNSLAGSPFSTQLYLDEAARNGGFNSWSRQVANRIGQGQVLSFPGPGPSLARRLAFRSTGEAIRFSAIGDTFKFIASQVGGDIITLGTNDLLGMVSAALGLNLGTANKLNAIATQLSQIQSELLGLQNQVAAVNATGSYFSNVNTINGTLNNIQNITTQLSRTASSAAAANGTSTAFDHGPAIPNGLTTIQGLLSLSGSETALRQITSYLISDTLSLNLVLLYNQMAAGAINSQVGTAANASPETFYYPLRQDVWTAGNVSVAGSVKPVNLQSNLDTYSSWVVQASNALAEAGQQTGVLPVPISTSGVNPPAVFLNQSRTGVLEAQLALLAAQQQVPAPMGYSNVLVDVPNQKMWYLAYFGSDSGYQLNSALGNAAQFSWGPWGPAPRPNVTQSAFTNTLGPNGGWRLPTGPEYQQLRSRAGGSLYPGLTYLGFNMPYGASSNSGCWIYGTSPGGSPDQYYYYDFADNQTHNVDRTGGGPLYGYLLVRNIPDYTSGDTPGLAFTSYGFLPDGLELGGDFTGSTGQFNQQNGQLAAFGTSNETSANTPLTQRAAWSSGNTSLLDLSSNGTSILAHWHGAGNTTVTATVKGFVPGKSGLQTLSRTVNLKSPLTGADTFSSVQITPYNVAYQAPPANKAFQQYYLTGFTQGGTAVTLNPDPVAWQVLDQNNQPVNPSVAAFSLVPPGGALDYGPLSGQVRAFKVKVTYNGTAYFATVLY